MALTNLTDLQTAIGVWAARTDVSASQINDFITLVEGEIAYGTYGIDGMPITPALRVRSMETRNASFPLTGEYTTLPTDYLEMREVYLTTTNPPSRIDYVTPEIFDATWLSIDSSPIKAYTLVGNTIRCGPGASTSDVLSLIYYAAIPSLVSSNTNWLMTKYPNVYLYGALRHLSPWTADLDLISAWQTGFVSAVLGLMRSEGQNSFSVGGALASRPHGVTVA